METILLIAVAMVWLVIAISFYLCSIGYDMRSRGFEGTYAITVLHQNEVSFREYYGKKDQHPVLENQHENIRLARLCMITAVVALLIAILSPFALSSL